MSDPKKFSSFGDLAKALGGGEPAEDPEDASPDEGFEDEDFDPADSEGVRQTIDRRPDGFGPMDHGPPPYKDVESEEMELLASFRVRTVFPKDVLKEIQGLPENPDADEVLANPHREDLRGRRIFTIDGADAKDFDDAICIEKLDDGFEVSVHIADVSHYVRPGTALDAEAVTRATSVYVADQVVPMLPEELSNGLCSLNPDVDRCAFSVFMEFDSKGVRRGYRITKSLIRSIRRCTYKAVQELLDGEDNEDTRRLADLKPDLEMFRDWTKKQQSLRDARGSLRMQSRERKFRFDADHEVAEIYVADNYFSQTLIEETALAANQAVGDFFKANGLPTIYRIHPEKDPEEIAEITEMLSEYGIRVPKKERLTGRDIGFMIRYARRQRNAEALISRIMGLLERATYEVRAHDERAEHFGLAREHYLHFTSPIRRYPDLIVHRMLYDVITGGDESKRKLADPENLHELCVVAGHASSQAEVAAMVEVAVEDLKVCQYMEPHIGEVFPATIVRVSRAGLDIQIKDQFITGFLPAKTIGNRSTLDGPVLKIQSRKGTRVFREGDSVEITVQDVDFVRLKVMFELGGRATRK